MENRSQRLNLSDESLVALLNFILDMVQEDRKNALDHHDTLASMLGGPPGAEGMTGLELQLLLNDLSQALTGFLNNSAKSTEQAIKVAQIMATHLTKMDKSATLTEDDRAEIEAAVQEFTEIKQRGQGLTDSIKFNEEDLED